MKRIQRQVEYTAFVAAQQTHLRRIAYALCGDWTQAEDLTQAALVVEDRTALFDAVQALPQTQRKVVVLRHWLGLSVEDTAAELGITVGTVKSHSSRALDKLQIALASEGM